MLVDASTSALLADCGSVHTGSNLVALTADRPVLIDAVAFTLPALIVLAQTLYHGFRIVCLTVLRQRKARDGGAVRTLSWGDRT